MNLNKLASRLAGALGLLLALSLILAPAPVAAVPQISHAFYGTVTMADEPAPEDTVITATVAGLPYTTTVDDQGRYGWDPMFKIPADDPATARVEGASGDDSIVFKIGDTTADLYDVAANETLESYPFAIGGYTELNLSIEGAAPPGPTPLVAQAGGPYSGHTGVAIAISGSASGGTSPYTYAWDLDNDLAYDDATGATTSHSWSTAGAYTIGLQVTDNATATDTDTATVTVTTPTSDLGGGGGGGGGTTYYIDSKLFGTYKSFRTNQDGVVQQDVEATSKDGKLTIKIPKGTKALDKNGKRLETKHETRL